MKVSSSFAKLSVVLSSVVLLCACATPNQVYWDHKVKELCEKDGGVTVYETVELTKDEYDALPKYDDKYVTVLVKDLAKKDQGFFSETKDTVINQSNPHVWKTDIYIKRMSDNKVIAKYATFHRRGGDISNGISHDSFYGCPDKKLINEKINEVFLIKGE